MDISEKFNHLISGLFNDNTNSDLTIKMAENRYHVHRFLLSIQSDVFRAMLNVYWTPKCTTEKTVLVLNEDPQCQPVFPQFLRFFYTGKIEDITINMTLPLYILADKYNVQLLKEGCLQCMLHSLMDLGNLQYSVTWYQYGKHFSVPELQNTCLHFMLLNIEDVIKSDDWITFTLENLIDILALDDLVVGDEIQLFRGVDKWLDSRGLDTIRSDLEKILPYVRFHMMTDENLREINDSRIVQSCQNQFMPYIYKAFMSRGRTDVFEDSHRIYTQHKSFLIVERFSLLSSSNASHSYTLRQGLNGDLVVRPYFRISGPPEESPSRYPKDEPRVTLMTQQPHDQTQNMLDAFILLSKMRPDKSHFFIKVKHLKNTDIAQNREVSLIEKWPENKEKYNQVFVTILLHIVN